MKRTASEIIRGLESRIAKLEKQSSKRYLTEDFQYPEESTKKQVIKELEEQLQFVYDDVFFDVSNATLSGDGTVHFDFTGSASIPAKMIPTPYSDEKVIKGLVKAFDNHRDMFAIDMDESLYMEPDENSPVGKIYWGSYDEAQPVFFDLRLEGKVWSFTTDLMESGLFSRELESKFEKGYFGFSTASTGNVKEDIVLLKPLLEKAMRKVNRSKG